MQIRDALQYGVEQLERVSETAQWDSQYLLSFALSVSRTHLMTWPEQVLTALQWAQFKIYINRRKQGEPVAYIRGKQAFWTFELMVSPDTLIPRPETELLIEAVISEINSPSTLLDLGTGSGAIALALAEAFSNARIFATDVSDKALSIAKKNAQAYQLDNIHFLQSHWFSNIKSSESFDCIVSNPPYIAKNDPHLNQGDLRFEPISALVAEDNGLSDFYTIIKEARSYLKEGGRLFLEHGYEQHEAIQELMGACGYSEIKTRYDLSGHPRVTRGKKKGL